MIPLPKVLDASGNEVRRIRPVKVSISENIVPLSSATLTCRVEDAVTERTYVELFNANGSVGIYRTRAPEIRYITHTCDITLEHGVTEVGDWLVRAKIDQTVKTLSAAITQVWAYYGGSKWQLGTVSATGDVVLSASYSNLLQTINSLVDQVEGAMLSFDFSTSPWTLNVVTRDANVSAEGRLGRNVVSASVKKDDSSLFTRVYVNGLTGGYMDADTVSQYGVIEYKYSDTEYTAAQAAVKAAAFLAKHKRPKYSISISGEDFSAITGETLDRVKIGKKYRLAIPEEGVTIEENIVALNWGDVYGSSFDVEITLSEADANIIDFVQQYASDAYGAGGYYDTIYGANGTNSASIDWLQRKTGVNSLGEEETLYAKITANYAAIQTEVGRASESEGSLSTRITQTADAITTEATRATAAEGTLSSRITQTADAITAEVTRAQGAEGTLSSRIQLNADSIALVVSNGSINAASIVAAINGSDSSVTISASHINLVGAVSITDLQEYDSASGKITSGLYCTGPIGTDDTITADGVTCNRIAPGSIYLNGGVNQVITKPLTIDGTQYQVLCY